MATLKAASRVVIKLKDGRHFSTAWSNHPAIPDDIPLTHFFTGKITARIIGTEDYLTDQEVIFITEEITPTPSGEKYPRIVLKRTLPSVTPGGRRIIPGAASIVEQYSELSLERIDSIIDSPEKSWKGWNGATIYMDDQFKVVLGEQRGDTSYVVHVSKEDDGDEEEPYVIEDRRRLAGQKSDLRRPVPHTVPDFLERLREYGFEIDITRRHNSVTHPDHPHVVCPVPHTPSDRRWADNLVAQIRLGFDIDVRQPK